MAALNERLILMGIIGRPHGVQGLLRVNSFTEDPAMLARYAPLSDRTGRRFGLEWVAEDIARLTEITAAGSRPITDRNEAERLTNTELFAPRTALPEPDEEEFYLADLIGLTARNFAGEMLGQVVAVHDYGGGTSLEIEPGPMMVPFTRAAVPDINFADGAIIVIPPNEIVAKP